MNTGVGIWTDEDTERAMIENRGLSTDKYIRGSRLGLGGSSIVLKIRRVSDGKVLAGKSSKAPEDLRREADTLKLLRHDHIVAFVELYQDVLSPGSDLLLMELCPHGTLQARIDQATPHMARGEILTVVLHVARGLGYLHARGLYHSDVKPRNVLIRTFHPVHVVLADFADVRISGQPGKLQGTPAYWSPEMKARGEHCGAADDMWALGVTLLGMVGQWPQMVYTESELEMYPGRCFEHVCGLRELNPGLGIVELLIGLLAWEAEERMTAEQCVLAVGELRGEEREEAEELGITSPEAFRPMSFW
ncbi:Protein kinase domain containing protein [Metarhizium album ARSEF 1941]|uniref:Protein kinase domain containing protein n=1 Tax=Metarhizium album (strain ARSEF 1941) TaxID=1081103 RepID=A0A0B2WWA3_METAS|nr:Protein kinase domain containing protein [Metarhizium album ARSEF 1941]KHN98323.1 Protein kinase domain containing protein [Metarhizium album ARSEF 1941]